MSIPLGGQEAVNALKAALVKMAVERIMKELVLSAPFFSIPVVNSLTLKLMEWIVDFIVNKTELGLYFVYTDMAVESQAKRLKEQLTKFNDEQNEENEAELIKRFDAFVRIKP